MRSHIIPWVPAALVLVGAGVVGLVAGATARMHARTEDEVRAMYRGLETSSAVVQSADLERLPAPVKRWLWRSGVVGRPVASSVRLRQSGEMHTSNEAGWFPVEAEQYFTTSEPGFVWWMEGRMAKVLPIAGRDKYVGGHGEMHIMAAGLVDVALGRGPKIDESALVRWLAEIVWFPSAALSACIEWEAISDVRARAKVTAGAQSASAVFTFDEEGRARPRRATLFRCGWRARRLGGSQYGMAEDSWSRGSDAGRGYLAFEDGRLHVLPLARLRRRVRAALSVPLA